MAKSIRDIPKKKRGRPASGGRRDGVLVRLESEKLSEIDGWSKRQKDGPSRPEAIRRLIDLGLTVKVSTRQSSNNQKLRAQEIAGGAIDRMTDQRASAGDKASRKRRLIKGPEEFRDSRVDRPKRK